MERGKKRKKTSIVYGVKELCPMKITDVRGKGMFYLTNDQTVHKEEDLDNRAFARVRSLRCIKIVDYSRRLLGIR